MKLGGPAAPARDVLSTSSVATAAISNTSLSIVMMIVQIGTFSLLARILTPQDYGIFAFANAILIYMAHLSQKGLSATLIRRRRVEAADYGAAYVIAIFMTLLSASALAAIWGALRALLPHLATQADILLFMALPLALQTLSSPALASLQRRFRFGALNLTQIAGVVIGNGIVAATLGLSGWGPWSLAFGAAANAFVVIALQLFLARSTLTLTTSLPLLRTHFVEGLHFNIVRSLDVAWGQLPMLLLTFISPPALVGMYQRIQFLADLALQMTVWRVTGVLYNAIAQQDDGATIVKARYRLMLQLCGLLILPIIAFTLVAADTIVAVLLGAQWMDGAALLRWLIVAFGLSTLQHPAGMALEHAGKLRQRTIQSGLIVLTLLALSPLYLWLPPSLLGAPATLSMAVSLVLIYAAVGERVQDVGEFIGRLVPGAVLAVAIASGASIPGWVLPTSSGAPDAVLLLLQLVGALVTGVSGLAVVLRLPGMSDILAIGEKAMPGLFARLRRVRLI